MPARPAFQVRLNALRQPQQILEVARRDALRPAGAGFDLAACSRWTPDADGQRLDELVVDVARVISDRPDASRGSTPRRAWIGVHSHQRGESVYLFYTPPKATFGTADFARHLVEDFEPEAAEHLDVFGPFAVAAANAPERMAAR